MIDRARSGQRCQARHSIYTESQLVPHSAFGTIQHDAVENGTRQLVFVEWANGIRGYVVPEEMAVEEASLAWCHTAP